MSLGDKRNIISQSWLLMPQFFRWGAIIENDLRLGDFFSDSDTRPIHLTEAEALYRTLSAIRQDLENSGLMHMLTTKQLLLYGKGRAVDA